MFERVQKQFVPTLKLQEMLAADVRERERQKRENSRWGVALGFCLCLVSWAFLLWGIPLLWEFVRSFK